LFTEDPSVFFEQSVKLRPLFEQLLKIRIKDASLQGGQKLPNDPQPFSPH